jgi:hypothetical protein
LGGGIDEDGFGIPEEAPDSLTDPYSRVLSVAARYGWSLSKVMYDQLGEEGVELPTERPDKPFMFLLMKSAEVCWSQESVDGAA